MGFVAVEYARAQGGGGVVVARPPPAAKAAAIVGGGLRRARSCDEARAAKRSAGDYSDGAFRHDGCSSSLAATHQIRGACDDCSGRELKFGVRTTRFNETGHLDDLQSRFPILKGTQRASPVTNPARDQP